MKVLFYTDTPNYGGAEKQMELLARHLRPLGCEVSLACGAYSVLSGQTDKLKTVYEKVYTLPTIHKHDPRHYLGLKKLLKDEQFDLIHIHLWNPGSCRYAFWAAQKAGIPIVTTEHDPFEINGIKGIIKRRTLNKTNQIIAISMDNFRQLSEYGEDVKNRLNIINNGIELDRFLDNKDKASLNVQNGGLPAGRQGLVIICIAELHERKGQKYLIEAFKKLQAEMPMLHLFLVGKGPNEAYLKSSYKNVTNLHFRGWRADVPQLLRASDVFVLPSLREAFGLVLVEAMASGVAVIATDNGGTKDIIGDGETGYLVPPANSDRLADAIRTLLRNPDQKRDMEKAALERVKAMFTADEMARKTLEVYKKAMSSEL
jgi:glycosyltransferase involved in cell wall biosynthesis